jgi:NAD(P)-dependent dehydrogenase (short-subunit alcohol dehydrogenase family)
MTLKRVIDADKISADHFFLRKSASAFHRYRCQPVMLPDVVDLAIFLASDESASCTGGFFPVDGGLTAI